MAAHNGVAVSYYRQRHFDGPWELVLRQLDSAAGPLVLRDHHITEFGHDVTRTADGGFFAAYLRHGVQSDLALSPNTRVVGRFVYLPATLD